MKRAIFDALHEAKTARKALVRAVDLQSSEERLVDPAADDSPLGRVAAQAAQADTSGAAEVDGRVWFLEVHNPRLELRIVGAVHIAQALSRMAALADYDVAVIDPRSAFATKERFPEVRLSHEWPDELFAREPFSQRSALVTLTHDPKIDDPALAAALGSKCFYIGALGSKRTHAARLARLKERGFDDAVLARIRGPVGLAIGARSPAEIAISIVAEMTMQLRTGGVWERSAARTTADTGLSPRS